MKLLLSRLNSGLGLASVVPFFDGSTPRGLMWIFFILSVASWPFYVYLPLTEERLFVFLFGLFCLASFWVLVKEHLSHDFFSSIAKFHYLPFYAFILYNGLSYLLFSPEGALRSHPNITNLLLSSLIFLIMIGLFREGRRYSFAIHLLINLLTAILAVLIFLHLIVFKSYYLTPCFALMDYVAGGFNRKNQLAFALLLIFPFVYCRFVNEKKVSHVLAFAVFTFAIFYTFSRMTVLSLFLALVAFCLIPGNRKRYFYHLVAILLILAATSLLTGITPEKYLELRIVGQIAASPEKAEVLREVKEQWLDLNLDRMDYVQKALKGFLENPLFGHGITSFAFDHAEYRPDGSLLRRPLSHNDYLQVLYELGLIGFCLLGLFLFVCFRELWKADEALGDMRWVRDGQLVSLAVLIVALNAINAYETVPFWFITAGAMAIPRMLEQRDDCFRARYLGKV